MNFKHIYEGYRNLLVPASEMKGTIQKVREERLEICNNCPAHSKHHSTPLRFDAHCTKCGCNLDAKSSCLACSCPDEKWTAVISDEQEENLKKEVYGPEANDKEGSSGGTN